MLCQNCGRQVEFVGNVCPWCGAQKMRSQAAHIYFYIWGFIGVGIGGFIGYHTGEDAGGFVGALVGGVILGVIGYIKGANAFNQQVACPHCKADLIVNSSQGPNYTCQNCGGVFHLSGAGSGETQSVNQNSNECPNCGYRTSFNVARNPDKYCGNCGKRFGG